MNIRLHHHRPTERTHCRICETRLTPDDDPVWGLCDSCLTHKRDYWISLYAPPANEPAATGAVKHPNRRA
jgi:hypothetical protein